MTLTFTGTLTPVPGMPHYGERIGFVTDSQGNLEGGGGHYIAPLLAMTGLVASGRVSQTGSKLFDVPGGYFVGGNVANGPLNPAALAGLSTEAKAALLAASFVPGVMETGLDLANLEWLEVQRGANDAGTGQIPIGGYSNQPYDFSLNGKLHLIVERARLYNPNIHILFANATQRWDISMDTANSVGAKCWDYNECIRNFVEQRNDPRIHLADLESLSGVCEKTQGALLKTDKLHHRPGLGIPAARVMANPINAAI